MGFARAWALAAGLAWCCAAYSEDPLQLWTERFRFREPPVSTEGICAGTVGGLPGFTVHPEASGPRLVRVSLPFPPAALPADMSLRARVDGREVPVDVRVLTRHPGLPSSVRRALITLPFDFESTGPHPVELELAPPVSEDPAPPAAEDGLAFQLAGNTVTLSEEGLRVETARGAWTASPIVPPRTAAVPGTAEIIEWGPHYRWVRLLLPDPEGPRILEVRADALGTVTLQLHFQHRKKSDGFAPDLGWRLEGIEAEGQHDFADGVPFVLCGKSGARVLFPLAPFQRRGTVHAETDGGTPRIEYFRCRAEDELAVPNTAWRRAAVVVTPLEKGEYSALLEPDLPVTVTAEAYDAVYGSGLPLNLALAPEVADALEHAAHAARNGTLVGDDFGNITRYDAAVDGPAPHAMMRINNAVPMLEAAYRRGDADLRDAALLWCSNTYDLGIWWGDETDVDGWQRDYSQFGGTRHPIADDRPDDPRFQWRRNPAFDFCTKGFDSFFYAYEETGDPRMSTALLAQIEYAREHIHSDRNPGQTRNVGIVSDFLRLYGFTGVETYRDEALKQFRELRTRLSDGDLFSQGGEPFYPDPPFIDDDAHGYKYPFPKPYILGYALQGLPKLLEEYPDEPKLRDVVRAVADFLAEAQDPSGGWRYPHPRSSLLSFGQAHEAAAVIGRAAKVLEARGENIDGLLDAVERVLRASVLTHRKAGTFLTNVSGWETSTGALDGPEAIYDLYAKPADRDPSRDYDEGKIALGIIPPENSAHLYEALRFYLAHRPVERLYHASDPLRRVLARVEDSRLRLEPVGQGAALRVSPADAPDVSVVLQGPESLGLPGWDFETLEPDWQLDPDSGARWYQVEGDSLTFVSTFIPRLDSVECSYTVWSHDDAAPPESLVLSTSVAGGDAFGPASAVEAGYAVATSSDGRWTATVAADRPETDSPAPSDGRLGLQVRVEPRLHVPTTARFAVYLVEGSPEEVRTRRDRDLARWRRAPAVAPRSVAYRDIYGVRDRMPRWYEAHTADRVFDGAWENADVPFDVWRARTRELLLDRFGEAPARVPFEPTVLEEERRDGYVARKIALNISQYCRIPAYLLVPDGEGPFPGIVALHDHGAHFLIGKEKVIRPFNAAPEIAADAQEWVDQYYGGRYIGDELARRGYAVLAIDATFWGERGRRDGVLFEEQQALAANMIQLGHSWAGYNAWDDLRSAEFLQGLPMVDPDRIGCLGLSMGAYRTWQLCAATDIVKAGAVICWMGDLEGFMVPDQNQTRGQSAFSMIHPGLYRHLDYPDVMSIACPKPMLVFAGLQDGLFAVDSVERCFDKLRGVWDSQGASDRLVCKFFDVPHLFNEEMQDEAFRFLDTHVKSTADSP